MLPDHPRWRSVFEHWVSIYTAVDPDQASTVDYANYRDTHQNWPIREGYGALIAAFGAGLPVTLQTPVLAIDYSQGSVRLLTSTGIVEAKAVILTVSTGVLNAEAIRFDPPLPEWKRDAVAAVPMGHANWVALGFERNPFGATETRLTSVWAPSPENMVFQIRPDGADVAIGFMSGSFCRELEREGTAAVVDFGMQKLKAMFGTHIGRRLKAQLTSTWSGDPAVRGAYAAALPGKAHLRAAIAAPVDNRLFFAGEATDPEFFTTVHGAYRSGLRAAHEVVHALRTIST